MQLRVYILFLIFGTVVAIELPNSCQPDQYYDPGLMRCHSCPDNASMVVSSDGFSCSCAEHSIPSGAFRCKPCNVTEVVSSDGRSCVRRRCQVSSGRTVCRKCPNDYISVTQNFDGSPMKELLCVKCARGYRAEHNQCVRCTSCACARHEVAVRGVCVTRRFLNERPKHEETKLHPFELLDVVKLEYLCMENDVRACRQLASECVKRFYSADVAGACRLWVQPKLEPPKGLPHLVLVPTNDKNPGEISLNKGTDTLKFAVAEYSTDGGFRLHEDYTQSTCFLPVKVKVGDERFYDCNINITKMDAKLNGTYSPFLNIDGELKPLPVSLRKTDGLLSETWSSGRFRRYFLIDNVLSTTSNATSTVYLRTLLIQLRVLRDKYKSGSLNIKIYIEAQYAARPASFRDITMSLKIEQEMPSAGVLRGLEIWGGVLGSFLTLYALVQWRGVVRRGGLFISMVPLLAGSLADALYFAAWFSSLHALAAEAGTLGLTLPLSKHEDYMIKAFVYSAVALKAIKVIWMNWRQCSCDIFFLDWLEYNPMLKDMHADKSNDWRVTTLAREWSLIQTKRRAQTSHTVVLALIILHLMSPWQAYLPPSLGYTWAVASLGWWCAYTCVLSIRFVTDKISGPPTDVIPKACNGVGLSLIVFQEEFYAHYVHGRNDDTEGRSMSGPLATCRVVCAQQLRTVFKQLSTPGLEFHGGLTGNDSRQALLSRFLAAFFERALDGLSWVASERTVLERLLDVELTDREAGNTSSLLYDPDDGTPSCFSLTWWGEEWTLGTFDALVFGCVVITGNDILLAALVTVVVWQFLKLIRNWLGNRNQSEKTGVEVS